MLIVSIKRKRRRRFFLLRNGKFVIAYIAFEIFGSISIIISRYLVNYSPRFSFLLDLVADF